MPEETKPQEVKHAPWLLTVAMKRIGAVAAGWVVAALTSGAIGSKIAAAGVSVNPEAMKEFVAGLIVTLAVALHDRARMTDIGRKLKL